MGEDMDSSNTHRVRVGASLGALLAVIFCVNAQVLAQDQPVLTSPMAPPPMKFIPSPERIQLSGATDAKSRLKTSILLAETRLSRAEQFTVDQQFVTATTELGVYQAIIEDILRYLSQQKSDSNKTRDLYKRLEIQLRTHSTRIESMRRVTPAVYAVHLSAIWDFADGARARALNGFFNDTVMPSRTDEGAKTSANENSPTSSTSPPKKQ